MDVGKVLIKRRNVKILYMWCFSKSVTSLKRKKRFRFMWKKKILHVHQNSVPNIHVLTVN